jgi:hypothetical protein
MNTKSQASGRTPRAIPVRLGAFEMMGRGAQFQDACSASRNAARFYPEYKRPIVMIYAGRHRLHGGNTMNREQPKFDQA